MTVWKWLLSRNDLKKTKSSTEDVPRNSTGQPLTQIDPVLLDEENVSRHAIQDESPNHEDVQLRRVQAVAERQIEQTRVPSYSKIALVAPTDRVWYALTGHGPDFKRVPQMQFDLLSIIAAHGKDGIAQPELVKISGQDKRSVPKRTDMLHNAGYIEKKTVVWGERHMITSLCTLIKFVDKNKQTLRQWQSLEPHELRHAIFHKESSLNLILLLDFIISYTKGKDYVTIKDLRNRVVSEGSRSN